MKNKKNLTSLPLYLAAVLMCLVLTTTHLLSGLYARYTTSADTVDRARTAMFVFRVNDQEKSAIVDLTEIKKPGDTASYSFKITNAEGGSVSEVAQDYRLTFTELGSLPLIYTYYKEETQVETKAAETKEGVKTIKGQFSAGSKAVDLYTVTITWPKEKNEAIYASGSGFASLKMDIVSEQID